MLLVLVWRGLDEIFAERTICEILKPTESNPPVPIWLVVISILTLLSVVLACLVVDNERGVKYNTGDNLVAAPISGSDATFFIEAEVSQIRVEATSGAVTGRYAVWGDPS